MQRLFQFHDRFIEQTPMKIIRECGTQINWDTPMLAIRGAKGVGKSTILRQHIRSHYKTNDRSVLYCSLDNNYFADHSILDLAEQFYRVGGKHLFLDEIHKYDNWSRELKEIYDLYATEMRIVISGSSLLSLQQGNADLSRRCVNHDIQGLSFREFLRFYKGLEFPVASLEQIIKEPFSIIDPVHEQCRPLAYFDEYLTCGYYPYYKDNVVDYYTILNNVVRYIIEDELPRICKVELSNTRQIRALMNILASGEPFEVDITKLSVLSGLQRKTILTYLNHLSNAKLIHLLYSDYLNAKKMQKPDKIYIENANMLKALATHPIKEGTLRETFVINHLAFKHSVEYGKQHGDFVVDGKYTFEVGGANKNFKQIADIPNSFILADDIDYPFGNKLPLWLIGFVY